MVQVNTNAQSDCARNEAGLGVDFKPKSDERKVKYASRETVKRASQNINIRYAAVLKKLAE